MKFAFVTCVKIGLSCMEAIYKAKGKLDLIITLPDDKATKKSGRIYIDEFAKRHNIPVVKIIHINDKEATKAIRSYNIDWLFIIGWSQIASKEVVDAPNLGVIGAHPTLLPIGRGRAAIPWAIIKGLDKTGVTFFKMDEGVDTGLILGQEIVPILANETATSLYEKINLAHETLMSNLYFKLNQNKVKEYPQNEDDATYWAGRKPEDGEILPRIMSLDQVDKLVRATTKPYPGAFLFRNGEKIIIWEGFNSDTLVVNTKFIEIILKDGFFYGTVYEILEI